MELGIDRIYTTHSSWFNEYAQIDLLIDRDDRIINICEIKFYNNPIAISKQNYTNFKNKLLQFKENSRTNKNVFLTMISTFGISENAYSLELFTNSLTMECLFKESR